MSHPLKKYKDLVITRYQIYNSLFINLSIENKIPTGAYIPLLLSMSQEGFKNGLSPLEIINDFFNKHTEFNDETDKIDFLFQLVKYIEREVLLFDCTEDAAFKYFKRDKLFNMLANIENDGKVKYRDILKNKSIRIVFTAHPTQFYTEKVQLIMGKLRSALKQDNIVQINNLLQQLAFTPFMNQNKPTPYDEAKNIIFYLRFVYYEAFGRLYSKIAEELKWDARTNPNLIELGFWPGGDRDGNPFVTASTTLEVAKLLRNTIMKCYYNHFKELSYKLTFKEVVSSVDELRNKLYTQIFSDEVLITAEEILMIVRNIQEIIRSRYNNLYGHEIHDFLCRVELFGDHFAALDIRQESGVHHDIMEEILSNKGIPNYNNLVESEKIKILTSHSISCSHSDIESELGKDTLANIAQIKTIQVTNGKKAIHRYIISNTESALDVLNVFAMFRFVGYAPQDICIDIVPLFETMKGMADSIAIMEKLYTCDTYRSHLNFRGNTQTIMLGFSDGTKDGGYLKSNYEIYKIKVSLTKLSKKYGLKVIFFDGRGGPPARGGGNTNRFYAAQGPEIAGDNIQLTIQGQTITSIFGTKEHAVFNLEQLILATVQNNGNINAIPDFEKEVLEKLANSSYEKYLALKNHPCFIPYLEEMTTLRYYSETNIGSRPSKRKVKAKLELKDLRAIPFVGSWSLIKQNIPGFYGIGTAMEEYKDQPEILKNLYASNAYFRTLIDNSMMAMKKSFFQLTSYIKAHPQYGEFWQNLLDEFELSKKWALYISNQKNLMDNEPLIQASIEKREEIVLPLLTIQQYALQCIELGQGDQEKLSKLVVRCLFGNINAGRNSA